MNAGKQPQFTSASLSQAWDTTAAAVQDLLTGKYPEGLHAAERTWFLKTSMEHLKAYLTTVLGELAIAEQDAAKATAEAAKAPCKDCPPAKKEA